MQMQSWLSFIVL